MGCAGRPKVAADPSKDVQGGAVCEKFHNIPEPNVRASLHLDTHAPGGDASGHEVNL